MAGSAVTPLPLSHLLLIMTLMEIMYKSQKGGNTYRPPEGRSSGWPSWLNAAGWPTPRHCWLRMTPAMGAERSWLTAPPPPQAQPCVGPVGPRSLLGRGGGIGRQRPRLPARPEPLSGPHRRARSQRNPAARAILSDRDRPSERHIRLREWRVKAREELSRPGPPKRTSHQTPGLDAPCDPRIPPATTPHTRRPPARAAGALRRPKNSSRRRPITPRPAADSATAWMIGTIPLSHPSTTMKYMKTSAHMFGRLTGLANHRADASPRWHPGEGALVPQRRRGAAGRADASPRWHPQVTDLSLTGPANHREDARFCRAGRRIQGSIDAHD